METNKTIRGLFILLIVLTLLTGWLGFWILHKIGLVFDAYPYIPVYFFAFGSLYILLLKGASKYSPKRLLMTFMGVRMAKLLISILLIIIYGVFVGEFVKEFIFTFLAFYLFYLLIEIEYFFYFKNNDKDS